MRENVVVDDAALGAIGKCRLNSVSLCLRLVKPYESRQEGRRYRLLDSIEREIRDVEGATRRCPSSV